MAALILEDNLRCELLVINGAIDSNEYSIDSKGILIEPNSSLSGIDFNNSSINTKIFKVTDPNRYLDANSNFYCNITLMEINFNGV